MSKSKKSNVSKTERSQPKIAPSSPHHKKNNTQASRYDKHSVKASHFGINPRMFSRNAITVVEKLQRQGYEAYIVGGCLRDLLLGKHPKDFDVATNARPDQIQAVFQRQ